jgi:diguanylate cyclase (GGDEF)-like protein
MLAPMRRLLVPVVLLGAGLLLRSRWLELDPADQQLLQWLPFVTLGIAAALGAFYNRARLTAAALALFVAHTVLPQDVSGGFSDLRTLAVFSLLSLALPLILLALLFATERGVRTRHGLFVLGIAPALWLAVAWLSTGASLETWGWFAERLPPYPHSGFVMSWRALAVFAVALSAALTLLVVRGGEDTAALAGSLMFAFALFALFDRQWMPAAMLSAAGINLCVSLLRSSHEMAFRDELTGVLGRRALNDRLKGLGRRYTIAMVDVDHFKQFNDTWGHDVGDDVLKMVASRIDEVRGGGTAYRYGGEEFSVVFPGRTMQQCVPHLEEVRRAVARYQLVVRDSIQRTVPGRVARSRRGRRRQSRGEVTVSVTISIGMAERNERNATPEQVIEAADAALYRAKQEGRNRLAY